ncbi:MAG: sporulation protein [Sulfurovum sp. FS06-10]|nr:MAG: sporulation protein [Sulfurovum sp. FS06-10]
MNNLINRKSLFFFLISSLLSDFCAAQEHKNELTTDLRMEQLLKEKRKINLNTSIDNSYKIQLFYGNSEDSKRKLQEFKREFKEIEGTIVYTNPNFKVWVGNYETRIEVEKAMLEIKKKYPTALLIKPSK